jgi:hypothetical protein
VNALTKAAQDVLAERQRQINVEGWTPQHDDQHGNGDMARAAAAYCLNESDVPVLARLAEADRPIWPWPLHWWKPKDRRRNLVRAAALLLAEIERLDRAATKARVTNGAHGCERCDGEPECTCGVVEVPRG